MARRKKVQPAVIDEEVDTFEQTPKTTISGTRPSITQVLQTALVYLGVIFFVLWTLIGLYFIPVLFRTIQTGQYALMAGIAATPTPVPDPTPQTEADLPGIGRVNIACVQEALSSDALQKVITEQSTNSLNDEEKQKFQACVVASASPAASPSGQ